MQISDFTMAEFDSALRKTKTIIVPFGMVEAHGIHLPLSTDTLTPTFVAKAVADAYPVMIAPPVHYGVCRSTNEHPGTIGVTFETLLSLASDLVLSLYSQGLKNIVLLTGRGVSTHAPALILEADRAYANIMT